MKAPFLFTTAVGVALSFSAAADAQMAHRSVAGSMFHPTPVTTPQMRAQILQMRAQQLNAIRSNPVLARELVRNDLVRRDLTLSLERAHFFNTFGFPWYSGYYNPYALNYPLSLGYSSNPALYSAGYPYSAGGYYPSNASYPSSSPGYSAPYPGDTASPYSYAPSADFGGYAPNPAMAGANYGIGATLANLSGLSQAPTTELSEIGNNAIMVVKLPMATASVTIDSKPTSQSGKTRTFLTPAIAAGKNYTCTIEANWTPDDAPPRWVRRQITAAAGQTVTVDFTKEK